MHISPKASQREVSTCSADVIEKSIREERKREGESKTPIYFLGHGVKLIGAAGKESWKGMVTPRLFRTACACLTMCPFVICGGDRGDSRGFARPRTGACSAWVSLPPSHLSSGGSGSTYTSRCGAAPRPSAIDGSSPSIRSSAATAVRSLSSRKNNRSATARFFMLREDERHNRPAIPTVATAVVGPPPASSSLFARHGGTEQRMRGRGAGGFQLGAVTAVRSPGDGGGVATAVDGEGELRKAFDTSAGEEGLLGLDGFRAFADVRELLEEGLLREAEILAIWKAVPKADAPGDRVDFSGFFQAFARVDALFEEEDEEEQGTEGGVEAGDGVFRGGERGGVAAETEASFLELVGSEEGVLDLDGLLRWSEVTELLEEGLLTQQEVEQMWQGLPKVANRVKAAGAAGTEEGMLINLQGFLEFDQQLSDLFEDEEEDAEAGANTAAQQRAPPAESPPPPPPSAAAAAVAATTTVSAADEAVATVAAVDEGTPEGQFIKLSAGTGGVLTLDGLLGWAEVSELLEDDLITLEEVGTMFQALPKAKGRGSSSSSPAIDAKGFLEFARKLDEMFEEEAEAEEDEPASPPNGAATADSGDAAGTDAAQRTPLPDMATAAEAVGPKGGNAAEAKARLLSMSKGEMKDCGMGCGEDRRDEMLEALEELLATEDGNLVLGDGAGLIDAIVGEWRLLYTSSNAMEYNQGLTGLANTIPNAKFQGLRQILHADGMVFDAEYEEELMTGDESEPLIITVTSDWEVKQTSSLVTGKSTVAIAVAPKQIKYGFITVRSERWKTLRAMMLLDIAYLDADLRIMRGQTARQNFFVFARV